MADTERLAREVVARSRAGDLLVLTGPLGAGKTTLTQAIARVLGSTASVTSPTYTLVHEYPTPSGVLVHVDAYRLADAADVERLGLDDYLDRSRLTVVEWGEGLVARRPEALWLELTLTGSEVPDAAPDVGSDPDSGLDGPVTRTARWRQTTGMAAAGPRPTGDRPDR